MNKTHNKEGRKGRKEEEKKIKIWQRLRKKQAKKEKSNLFQVQWIKHTTKKKEKEERKKKEKENKLLSKITTKQAKKEKINHFKVRWNKT